MKRNRHTGSVRFPHFETLGRAVGNLAHIIHLLGRLGLLVGSIVWLTFDNARCRRLLEHHRRRLMN